MGITHQERIERGLCELADYAEAVRAVMAGEVPPCDDGREEAARGLTTRDSSKLDTNQEQFGALRVETSRTFADSTLARQLTSRDPHIVISRTR